MKKIAVIAHLYYPERYEELAGCLKNITQAHDLFITVRSDPEGDKLAEIAKRDFPEAQISRPANVGYDIWPFFSVFNKLDLTKYDYIVKLHTKRNIAFDKLALDNFYDIAGAKWRKYLLSFVSTPRAWRMALDAIAKPEIGIVAGLECIVPNADNAINKESLEFAGKILGKKLALNTPFYFVAGTMFLAKSSLLARLQDLFSMEDFENPDPNHEKETISHKIERLFGICAYCDKLAIAPYCRFRILRWKIHYIASYVWRKVQRFFYYRKINPKGKLTIRIFKIPVYRKMLDVSEQRLVFVSAVRDFALYDKLVRKNRHLRRGEFEPFDNRVENMPIPRRYNSFLETWDYSRAAWFVFLHEDFEFLEPLEPALRWLDKNAIYGITGVDKSGRLTGALLQCDKDGSSLLFHGRMIDKPEKVATADCCAVILHSSLVEKFKLRFDENLAYDLYAEDFEIVAKEKFAIPTRVIPVCSRHWSHGSLGKRFFSACDYLFEKHRDAKGLYPTTTRQFFGNARLVGEAKKPLESAGFKAKLIHRLRRIFWRVRTKPNSRYIITCLGIKVYSCPSGNKDKWLSEGLVKAERDDSLVPKEVLA